MVCHPLAGSTGWERERERDAGAKRCLGCRSLGVESRLRRRRRTGRKGGVARKLEANQQGAAGQVGSWGLAEGAPGSKRRGLKVGLRVTYQVVALIQNKFQNSGMRSL